VFDYHSPNRLFLSVNKHKYLRRIINRNRVRRNLPQFDGH
jgi:hypothetical protein